MGHPHTTVNATADQPAQFSDESWVAPRLSKALFEATPGIWYPTRLERDIAEKRRGLVTLEEDVATELVTLFEHLFERLDLGLWEPWFSKAGYDLDDAAMRRDQKDHPDLTPEQWARNECSFFFSPEECWARAFSELVVFTRYAGVGQVYGLEADLYRAVPGVVPINFACQSLATYCILSRGFDVEALTRGAWVGCACAGGTDRYSAFEASPMPARGNPGPVPELGLDPTPAQTKAHDVAVLRNKNGYSSPPTRNAVALSTDFKAITPGSVAVYNPGGWHYLAQDLGDPTHIAPVLRNAAGRLQFIDTPSVIKGVNQPANLGAADNEFTSKGIIPQGPITLGVLKPAPAGLAGVEDVAKARPLGLTRLVVSRTSSQQVIFVSPLLHMRWPVSRLLWSLRNLPADDVTVTWHVFVPHARGETRPNLKGWPSELDAQWTTRLMNDGTTPPAELLTPVEPPDSAPAPTRTRYPSIPGRSKEGVAPPYGPYLMHANIISGSGRNAGGGDTLLSYHRRITTRDEGWQRADDRNSRPALKDYDLPLAGTLVLDWCMDPDTFGKRFLGGGVDDAPTGHSLVDPSA